MPREGKLYNSPQDLRICFNQMPFPDPFKTLLSKLSFYKQGTKVQEIKLIICSPCTPGSPTWTHRNTPWSLLGWQQGHESGGRTEKPRWVSRRDDSSSVWVEIGHSDSGSQVDLVQKDHLKFLGDSVIQCWYRREVWAHVKGEGWLFIHVFDNLAAGHPYLLPSYQTLKWCAIKAQGENCNQLYSSKKHLQHRKAWSCDMKGSSDNINSLYIIEKWRSKRAMNLK